MNADHAMDWKIRIRPYEWLIWVVLLIGVAAAVNHNARLDLKTYYVNFAVLSVFCLFYFAYSLIFSLKKTLKGYKHEAITEDNFPAVYGLIRKIEIKTGITVLPKAYVIEHKESTAMALPWGIFSRSAIFLSKKLLQEATQDELESIIAHEIGHIRCREALIIIAQGLITVILLQYLLFYVFEQLTGIMRNNLSWSTLFVIFFYAFYVFSVVVLLSKFICNQLNKRSELYADYFSAMVTGKPRPLIDFLQKSLDECLNSSEIRSAKLAVMIYRFHMFLFSSYPTIMKRVEQLKDLE